MPGIYVHRMVTEKALERLRGNQDLHEKLRAITFTHSHFVHLGSSPDYPHPDLLEPTQKVAAAAPLLIFPMTGKAKSLLPFGLTLLSASAFIRGRMGVRTAPE